MVVPLAKGAACALSCALGVAWSSAPPQAVSRAALSKTVLSKAVPFANTLLRRFLKKKFDWVCLTGRSDGKLTSDGLLCIASAPKKQPDEGLCVTDSLANAHGI